MHELKNIGKFLWEEGMSKVEITNAYNMKVGDIGILIKACKKDHLGKAFIKTNNNHIVMFHSGKLITNITHEFGLAFLVSKNMKSIVEELLLYFNGALSDDSSSSILDLKNSKKEAKTCPLPFSLHLGKDAGASSYELSDWNNESLRKEIPADLKEPLEILAKEAKIIKNKRRKKKNG